MKDHEIAALVNELRDIAVDFHAAQQLRERIAHVIIPHLKRLQFLERSRHGVPCPDNEAICESPAYCHSKQICGRVE